MRKRVYACIRVCITDNYCFRYLMTAVKFTQGTMFSGNNTSRYCTSRGFYFRPRVVYADYSNKMEHLGLHKANCSIFMTTGRVATWWERNASHFNVYVWMRLKEEKSANTRGRCQVHLVCTSTSARWQKHDIARCVFYCNRQLAVLYATEVSLSPLIPSNISRWHNLR